MSSAASSSISVNYQCQITEIPFPLIGKFPFEKEFGKHSLNSQLEVEIERVKAYMNNSDAFKSRAEEYQSALENRLNNNKLLLSKRLRQSPEFSASVCVRTKDLDGLKLIVANRMEGVNKQDSKGRAAIHFAVSSGNPDIVKVLMLHEDIETCSPTKSGNLPKDIAATEEIRALLK